MAKLFSLLMLIISVSCGEKALENRRTLQEKEVAAVEPSDGTMPLPQGVSKTKSPFSEEKVWLPNQDYRLNDAKENIMVLHKNVEPCLTELPQIPGYQYNKKLFDDDLNESYSSFETNDRDAILSLSSDPCVIGVVWDPEHSQDLKENNNPLNAFNLVGDTIKETIEYDKPAINGFLDGVSARAKVAIIDTGVDLRNPNIKDAVAKDLRVTTTFYNTAKRQTIVGDNPQDEHGHGTQVASIIAHNELGLMSDHVELFPIKVSQGGVAQYSHFVAGISMAVNKGVDIITLTMGANMHGCNPAVGYAIYRGIEKGVMFVISAGNGKMTGGEEIGFPIVAARDDGPADYGFTQAPACWSRYFLGAVSVGATSQKGNELASFSNFGDDVELSAPGVDIATESLDSKQTSSTGTSFSAPIATAAAALAVVHHRHHGLSVGPWYLENLLVESAKKDPNALENPKRVRFGSQVSFRNMMALLERTESMSDEQRRNDIRTINPRQGDGWNPGEDKSNLKALHLTTTPQEIYPGEELSYKSIVFFRHGKEKDVTGHKNTSVSISDKERLSLKSKGTIAVATADKFDFKAQKVYPMVVTTTYLENQALVSASQKFFVKNPALVSASQKFGDKNPADPDSGGLREIVIEAPATPVRIWQNHNAFKAVGLYADGEKKDITGSVVWSSSSSSELRATAAPGVFSSDDAYAGKNYRIFANLMGVEGTLDITVEDETLSKVYIHNYLGQSGKIEIGQKVVLEPRFVLSDTRERAAEAKWSLNGKALNNGALSSRLEIDTKGMTRGSYILRASAVFRKRSTEYKVDAKITLELDDGISRIEIHLKRPIVSSGSQFQVDLRAYRENNSYIVVTEQAEWSSSNTAMLKISDKGLGYAEKASGGNTYSIKAKYKGRVSTTGINVIDGSVVTGSDDLIDSLAVSVLPRGSCNYRIARNRDLKSCFCQKPGTSVTAYYKDGKARLLNLASVSYAEKKPNDLYEDMVTPIFGGRTFRVSATYNDGNLDSGGGGNAIVSTEITYPQVKSDEICDHNPYDRTNTPHCVENNPFRLSLSSATLKNFILNDPVVMYNNAYGPNYIEAPDLCSIALVSVEPSTGLGISTAGNLLEIRPLGATPGRYKVKVKGYYTGGGYDEEFTREFELIIKRAVAKQATLLPAPYPYYANPLYANKLPYGTNQFDIRVYSEDDPPVQIIHTKEDLEIELFDQNNKKIDIAASAGFYESLSSNNIRLTMGLFPKTFDATLRLKVTYKPDNLSAEYPFQLYGANEFDQPKKGNPVKIVEPVPNDSVHPSCSGVDSTYSPPGQSDNNDTGSALTKNDPSAGDGTEKNPYIICTANQLLQPTKSRGGYFKLGQNIDFRGHKINPIKFADGELDGDNHSISNYVIIDSETDRVGLFHTIPTHVKNLILVNPSVRGRRYVGALAGVLSGSLKNVYVKGGVVWGHQTVGGLVGQFTTWRGETENIGNFGTIVQYEGHYAGGLFGILSSHGGEKPVDSQGLDIRREIKNCYMSGKVAPAGLPNSSTAIGGIAGAAYGNHLIRNCLVTGNTIALNHQNSDTLVGGIAGIMKNTLIIDSVVTGNIVSTGSAVGGIVGMALGRRGHFGLPFTTPPIHSTDKNHMTPYLRRTGVLRSSFSGQVWAGMSRKYLTCTDEVVEIIGKGGGEDCLGDIKNQNGGYSDAGGIAGSAVWTTLQENHFSGTVRGVKRIGGLVGVGNITNFVRNTVSGTVSASDGGLDYGALAGWIVFGAGKIPSRFDGNQFTPSAANGKWAVGKNGDKAQVVDISKEPTPFP